MELTLLLEAWLNKDEFSEVELKLFDECIPYYIYTYTSTVNRTDGEGMKLIKIHLLHHFSTMVWLYGCCKNFNTFIPEQNHKAKVKEHAIRTHINPLILNIEQPERIMKIAYCMLQNKKLCCPAVSFVSLLEFIRL